MPKHYISSENLEKVLEILAKNLTENVSLDDKEVSSFISKLLKGIIDDHTIRKRISKKYRKPYGFLQTCDICGKKKIRDMSRHMSFSHKKQKIVA